MQKIRKEVILCTVVAVIAGVAGALMGHYNSPAPLTTTVAPATAAASSPVAALFGMSMNDAKGTPQALDQWQGKAVIVNFWAPWCAPCVEEMPELDALAKANSASGVHVIGIGIDSPGNIAQFAEKFKISYPLYVAGMSGTDLSRQFGNTAGGLPYTVLIGADGKVRKTYLGRLKFDQLKADLAALPAP